jgi:L-alanine-DL-glutamate epimerase-like enolase superfamily enzyme
MLAENLRGRELLDILSLLAQRTRDLQHEQPSNRLALTGSIASLELPWSGPLLYGLETALLDALAQASEQNLATFLSSEQDETRSSVKVNAVISGSTTAIAVAKAQTAIAAGFTCLKIKLTGPAQECIERVAAIRSAVGLMPELRLDANEGWDREQARFILTRCADYHIQYVEQPLPASDLDGMARLRKISPVPLAADEAISTPASVRQLLAAEAVDVLILKPQLVGGLLACRQIIQVASQQHVTCVLTSNLESGVGVVAALHLAAASPAITDACGLATLDLLEHTLLCHTLTIRSGSLPVPESAGLGIQIDREALHAYTWAVP